MSKGLEEGSRDQRMGLGVAVARRGWRGRREKGWGVTFSSHFHTLVAPTGSRGQPLTWILMWPQSLIPGEAKVRS